MCGDMGVFGYVGGLPDKRDKRNKRIMEVPLSQFFPFFVLVGMMVMDVWMKDYHE